MKVLITGGHITPALAVIEELKKHPGVKIIFVGRKNALDFEKTLSFEYRSIKRLGIKFIDLKAGRLTRTVSLISLINFLKFPLGFFAAFKILTREKPDIILSFGGYLALPIAVLGWLIRIPVFTHEQTLIPGLTNRIIGLFAKRIFISFPQAGQYFDRKKVVFTGNPLRSSIFSSRLVFRKPSQVNQGLTGGGFNFAKLKKTTQETDKKVIYITGGSLGSHRLNLLIEAILPKLLKNFLVIHQTGDTKQFRDFERLSKINHRNYFIKRHFFDDEIGLIYSLADLVVGRAGANTVFELIVLKKPAVLIPLPWSAYGEQETQARLLKRKGVAEVFYQNDDKINNQAIRLYHLIIKVSSSLGKYQKNFNRFADYYKHDAASKIVDSILPAKN